MNQILGLLVATLLAFQLFGQSTKLLDLQYISPVPGSRFVMPGNNIALRSGQPFDPKCLFPTLLEVKNSTGKNVEGSLKLSKDKKTLIYIPDIPFPFGETISVKLNSGLKTISDFTILPVQFNFTVTDRIVPAPPGFNQDEFHHDKIISNKIGVTKNTNDNNLPEGFPVININIFDSTISDQYFFFAPWTYGSNTTPYLIIMDGYGTPIYYRECNASVRDFKVQHNGCLSFAMIDQIYKNIVMDSNYCIIDEFQIGNGYNHIDLHDFQYLDNEHAFVIAYDWQIIGMDTVVPGGHPAAMVCGFIIQEQDLDKNVIFQWRSWDHYLITDAGPFVDLTNSSIDYVHGNSVEVESDTSILISSRNMDEITKIHRNTGEIIWRLGGKNNQFNILNDTLGFSMQHDCRSLSNGHITLFDNGRLHPDPKFSSVLEYDLDEDNYEAVLVRRLRNNPDIYGNVMGNTQKINDSSFIVGWGNGSPGITQVSLDGEVKTKIAFQGVSYRAYLFPWETNYFVTNTDSLQYKVRLPDSSIREIQVFNNNEFEIEISSTYNKNPVFRIIEELPLLVPASDSLSLQVIFQPDSAGYYYDILTINRDINSDTLVQRIAQQIFLKGFAKSIQLIDQYKNRQILVYPNPVSEVLIIEFPQKKFSGKIELFNIYGKLIVKQMVDNCQKIQLNLAKYPKGLYFVSATEQYGVDSKVFKIIID